MQEEFLRKLKNNEYISKKLYEYIKDNSSIVPPNFDLDNYNNQVLNLLYQKYYDYFKNMYKGIDDNITLDEDQIKAILADEDYSLIIAGAGTGKTTTMASKVKYLVDIKKVKPERIAVMSYTKKATEELESRIYDDFGIPAKITTFHSLGFMHVREIFNNRKCYVIGEKEQNDIFLKYFKEKIFPDKDKIKEIIDLFSISTIDSSWMFGKYFKNNYDKYQSFDDYFKSYKKYFIDKRKEKKELEDYTKERINRMINNEHKLTIKGELVKSKGEAIIANYLYSNGIEYEYEKIYENLMQERIPYHPDFTLNLDGDNVYVEYFGLSNYDKTNISRYEKIRKRKEDYHKEHHNKFIAIDYSPNEIIIEKLENELIKMGFKINFIGYEKILEALLNNNQCSQFFPFRDFIFEIIELIKESADRNIYYQKCMEYVNSLTGNQKEQAERQFYYINDFYKYYQKQLFDSLDYGFDYSDMIYYANKYINSIGINNKLQFDYLIIDEYQDISQLRYEFTRNIMNKNLAKVVAVGDDWQSIYAFSGAKINYVYNFEKYFQGAKLLGITKNYRNSQSLIDYAGEFIMRNNYQIKKNLIADKDIKNPIKFVKFDENEEEIDVLRKLILTIHHQNPNHKILILARKNATINNFLKDKNFHKQLDTKVELIGYNEIDINAMTIHKSKGLTSDEVIIMGLDEKFPLSDKNDFWLKNIFKYKSPEEGIPFAEERRVFYVALTRTKNNVYLLINKNVKHQSDFVQELYNIVTSK